MDHRIGDEENNLFVGLFFDGLSPQVQTATQEPVRRPARGGIGG